MIDLSNIPPNGDWLQLHSGKALYFLDPKEEDIDIGEIAHTLSLLCRFGGHCSEFYSVAEHSIHCSYHVAKGFELEALLHDATEAYLVDMPRPIKRVLSGYKYLEDLLDKVIRKKFNLPETMSPEVHLVDNQVLATEKKYLMKDTGEAWENMPEPLDFKIKPVSSKKAYINFLRRFDELTNSVSQAA